MPILDIRNVSKSFGSLKALDDVSFCVSAGSIFGIAGPNGSGKSTLFNTITRIPFGPDRGEVLFEEAPLHRLPAHEIARRGLTRTFQRETCFDKLTVFENVLVAAAYGKPGRTAQEHRQHAIDALDVMEIGKAAYGRNADELSVFDRKCLMLATAMATKPRVLLLDEPASGLTKPEIEKSIDLIRRIAERGVTIVLIEHVLTFLMSLSQQLMVLNQGKVLAAGDPDAVIADPRVVEAYLGTRKHDA